MKVSKQNIYQMRGQRRNSIEEMGEFVQVEFWKIRFDCPVNSIAEIREQKMELEEKYQRLVYPNKKPAEKVTSSFDYKARAVSCESNKKEKERDGGSKRAEEFLLSDSASGFDSSKEKERFRRERVGGKQASSGSKFEFPEPKFRNFTNIFGKKLVKKSSKPERVTLQSIMRTNWNLRIN